MSAVRLGERLFGEVKEERLDEVGNRLLRVLSIRLSVLIIPNQLLYCLRDLHSAQQISPLGVPPLDRFLTLFLHPYSREPPSYTQSESTQSNPRLGPSKRSKPPVVEITSATPCAGKRQLLYYIAAASVLPESYDSVPLLGQEGAVIVLDTDNQFDVLRLRDVLSSLLISRLEPHSPNAGILLASGLSSVLHDSLRQVHIFRPQSPASLLSTLRSLPAYLLNPAAHFSSLRALQALIVTNLSAFLWQTRLESDEGHQLNHRNTNTFIQYHGSMVQELAKVQQIFGCVLVAANQGLSPLQWMRNGEVSVKPTMPGVWNNFCTLKLVVGKDMVRKFGPGISAEEAMHEREQRKRAVAESRFWCRVNWWDSGEWDAGVVERLRSLDRGGAFSFHISDTEVRIEDAG